MNCPLNAPQPLEMPYSTFMTQTGSMNQKETVRVASLAARHINDWLYGEMTDNLHDICYEIIREEHPELEDDELWDVLPEVFDRLNPFTAS